MVIPIFKEFHIYISASSSPHGMTLKTIACDSIAEKIRFVNEFFLSLEIGERGMIL